MNRAAIASIMALTAGPVAADDSVGTSDTVASTWSGGVLRLAEGDNRFTLALGTLLPGGVRLRGEVSAPLDETTRTATFLRRSGLAPAFRGTLHVGYDSTYNALDLDAGDRVLLQYCEAHKIEPCTASAVAKARRRDGQPIELTGLYWSLGLDLSYAYDRTTAYFGDIGDGMTSKFSATDLQLGASGMLYAPGGWVVSLRGGYERNNPVDIAAFQRCELLASKDTMVTGETCNDAFYLVSNPGPQRTGYLRAAGAYYPAGSALAHYLSATEIRVNFEHLGNDAASLDGYLILFARGLSVGAGSIRLGIGARARMALADADHRSGDLFDYSLFGVAGTSF